MDGAVLGITLQVISKAASNVIVILFFLKRQKRRTITLGVVNSVRPKNRNLCMKLNWSFQTPGWSLKKSFPFQERGMGTLWNYIFISIKEQRNFQTLEFGTSQ